MENFIFPTRFECSLDFLRWFGGIEEDRPKACKELLVIRWPSAASSASPVLDAQQNTLVSSEEDVLKQQVEYRTFTSFDSMHMVVDVCPKVIFPTRLECKILIFYTRFECKS